MNPDVIIVGGGVIGSACAYYLSKAGRKVLVLERDDTGMGTCGATDGLLSWLTKKAGFHLDLFLKSRELFEPLQEELGGDIGLRHNDGTIQVVENEVELELVRQTVQRDDIPEGYTLDLLDIKQLLELEPNASPGLLGALFVPQSGVIETFDFVYALVRNAKAHGAVFQTGTEVTGFQRQGDRITGVRTNRGDYSAGAVVNCCGTWGAELAKLAGVHLDIKPRRGQIAIIEPCERHVHHYIHSSQYQIIKHYPEMITDEAVQRTGYSFGVEQTAAGTILISGTREFVEYDTGNTIESLGMIVEGAAKIFPSLREMHVIRAFSGLRPYTPDSLPVVGTIDGLDGLVMACGHEGDGIALAPITGTLVKELLVDGKPSFDLAPVSPNRFTQVG